MRNGRTQPSSSTPTAPPLSLLPCDPAACNPAARSPRRPRRRLRPSPDLDRLMDRRPVGSPRRHRNRRRSRRRSRRRRSRRRRNRRRSRRRSRRRRNRRRAPQRDGRRRRSQARLGRLGRRGGLAAGLKVAAAAGRRPARDGTPPPPPLGQLPAAAVGAGLGHPQRRGDRTEAGGPLRRARASRPARPTGSVAGLTQAVGSHPPKIGKKGEKTIP